MTATEHGVDRELELDLYRRMHLIRGFEDLVQSLFLRGEVYGTTHLYSGQEAATWATYSSRLDHEPRRRYRPSKALLSNSAWFSHEAWAGVSRGRHQPSHPAK